MILRWALNLVESIICPYSETPREGGGGVSVELVWDREENADDTQRSRVKSPHAILPTRVACRPPSNLDSRNASTISTASCSLTNLAGIQITFASLCVFARCAISGVQAIAALTSLCLFAVMATPFADPHIKIPSSESFKDTSFATA